MNAYKKITYLFMAVAFLLFSAAPTLAQQTIINVPSSEILPKGDAIFKESNNIPMSDPMRMTPSVIYGIGNGAEISAGVSTFVSGDNAVRADIAAKKVFFVSNSSRLTVGARVSPYLNRHSEPDSFVYSHISHRIKKTKTTLTAGAYAASRQECLPSNVGAVLGFEQVIIPNKLRLAVDYMSGSEKYGMFAAGLKYRPISTLSITSAILVSPSDDDRVAFSLSVSKFISFKKQPVVKERI